VTDLREQLQSGLGDRYRLERELGRGGMATVYLAHDLKHDRQVALKVLHPELAASLGPERFQREVRTTARLQHPHILPVLDSGEAAGQLWYTMPYVEGESLRDRLRREGQLPLDNALQITREVADTLEYAHGQGVVHRDIKPENILLSRGHALVADFGIARALQLADGDQLTETGVAVGTPAYMSPEQADGASSVDGRSDLYSLGCVLYEMLTGEVPYTGRTPQAVIAKRVLEPLPHVRTLRQSVPEAVEQAINRALAVTPADRFATAAEFIQALTQSLPSPKVQNTPTVPQPRTVAGRWGVRRGLATLAVAVLLGIGVLLAWLRARPEPGTAGPKRLAVLPFENLGRPEDEYFTDGITDEVRGKLIALPGLEVIARTSSREYKQTIKSPQQIGRELGVDYLLTGTVRWEKDTSGSSRVRVSPELVQISTASTKWQAPFEASLTDVFRVQAHVAARVAEALGVTLGTSQRELLGERPTENLAAYDAFLKGEAATKGMGSDLSATRRALEYYERAVALDSTFALAWAQLSQTHSWIYRATPATAGAVAARVAAERAMTLAPTLPEAYRALAVYEAVVRHDLTRAQEYAIREWQLRPKDALLLTMVVTNYVYLGHAEEGLKRLQEAQLLDPRSVEPARSAATALLGLGRYTEAVRAVERALALAPTDLGLISAAMQARLAEGDLVKARAVLRAVPSEVDPTALVAHIANWGDYYWVLDDAQQRLLLRLSPAPFGDDRAAWSFALAETHALRGDTALARAYADSARMVFASRLREVPQDDVTHSYLGLALAYMGRKAEAVREGERALALVPVSMGPILRGDAQDHLAVIYVMVGQSEKALHLLESLIANHYPYLSPGWLKIDPNFAPLRGHPRFERLVNGT
jgi:TolB-like protein/tetratricopeptide (TPR) repeat protein/tRNA A-37 threonylcarbamoyl transferase component Bud32